MSDTSTMFKLKKDLEKQTRVNEILLKEYQILINTLNTLNKLIQGIKP